MRDGAEKRAVLLGAVIGATTGAVLAILFRRWRRMRPDRARKPIKAGQMVRLGAAIAGLVRQILELIA